MGKELTVLAKMGADKSAENTSDALKLISLDCLPKLGKFITLRKNKNSITLEVGGEAKLLPDKSRNMDKK